MTAPAPMTPADCDLRGYEYMPLFGTRLFGSDFEAHASDLAFRVAIRLYWESWQQVPAASLPNDDVKLCRLAGLGRDLKTWRKLRADGVLHGFILCSDDRLYHRLIAEQALKAWERSHRKDHQRDAWRDRQRRHRANNTNGKGENVTRDNVECHDGRHAENGECHDGSHAGQAPVSPVTSPRAESTRRVESREGESTERLRRSAPYGATRARARKAAADGDFHSEAFELAQQLLPFQPERTRNFLGRLLKLTGNNHGLVLAKLRECRRVHPVDPAAWLMAAVGHPVQKAAAKVPHRNPALKLIVSRMTETDDDKTLTLEAGHGG